MPEISRFFGIIITMYHNDHPPPHFHAKYGEFKAKLDIETGEVIDGRLPRRAISFVSEWRELHIDELMNDWNLIMDHQIPNKIEPLE